MFEVEGLPEGWKAVAYRPPFKDERYIFEDVIHVARKNMAYSYLIIEKIQPHMRIVLEETDLQKNSNCPQVINTSIGEIGIYHRYEMREVKETDIPLTNDTANVKMGVSQGDGEKLELSVAECKEAMRKLETFNVTDLSVKICRFLKENQ